MMIFKICIYVVIIIKQFKIINWINKNNNNNNIHIVIIIIILLLGMNNFTKIINENTNIIIE